MSNIRIASLAVPATVALGAAKLEVTMLTDLTKVAKDSDKMVALEKSYWATQDEIRKPDDTADLASIEKSKETGLIRNSAPMMGRNR